MLYTEEIDEMLIFNTGSKIVPAPVPDIKKSRKVALNLIPHDAMQLVPFVDFSRSPFHNHSLPSKLASMRWVSTIKKPSEQT